MTGLEGPYPTTAATLADGSVQASVQLWAMGQALSDIDIGRPRLREGRWLTASRPAGIVLETSFAQALHLTPGSQIHIDGLDGSSVQATVIGIADTSSQGFYPDQTPGLMWVLPGLLHRVEPLPGHTEQAVGLRLANPSSAGLVAQEAAAQLNGAVRDALTWQQVEQSMNGSDPLLGLLLALFGLVALGGALLAIGNAAGGRVLTASSDLAMLKTLGFTSRQLVGSLLAEHAGLAAVGAAAGVLVARLLTAALSRALPVGSVAAIAPLPAGWVLLFAAGTVATVLLATVVSGWRAGRARPLSDTGPPVPGGRLSGLTRVALLSRLPPETVLGARAAFTRMPQAAATIAGLALPVTMITIGIGFWATLDNMQRHPGQIGLAATLTVSPGSTGPQQMKQALADDPDIATTYKSVTIDALLPNATSAITTLGVGKSSRPYPFHVVQGRLYRAPGEAVASQQLLDSTGWHVGEYIRMPIGAVPVIFHIVGRIIEPEYGGQVLAYGIDTLTDAGAVPPLNVLQRGAQAWGRPGRGRRLAAQSLWRPARRRPGRRPRGQPQHCPPHARRAVPRPGPHRSDQPAYGVRGGPARSSQGRRRAAGHGDDASPGDELAGGQDDRARPHRHGRGDDPGHDTDAPSHRRGRPGLRSGRWPRQFPVGGRDVGGGRRRPGGDGRGRHHPGPPGR